MIRRCKIYTPVVRSDFATVTVPELELEIPPKGQKGEISTVEGILARTVAALEQDQPVRRHMDPEGAEQIDKFVAKIQVEIAFVT